MQDPREFEKVMSETNRIYAVCIISVDCTSATECSIIIMMKLSDATVKLKLSAVLENLMNTFSQKETDVLSLYDKNVHAINLENGNESFFKSLYNLSVSELEIIRTYLNIYLTKK